MLNWIEWGVFQYSPVDGARANGLPNPVNDKIKKERWHRFMQTQAKISEAKLQSMVGKDVAVIIDKVDSDRVIGRSYADAPEIDGNVIINSDSLYNIGDIVTAKIHKSDKYDLWGTVIKA